MGIKEKKSLSSQIEINVMNYEDFFMELKDFHFFFNYSLYFSISTSISRKIALINGRARFLPLPTSLQGIIPILPLDYV